jgi:hypothetical protein
MPANYVQAPLRTDLTQIASHGFCCSPQQWVARKNLIDFAGCRHIAGRHLSRLNATNPIFGFAEIVLHPRDPEAERQIGTQQVGGRASPFYG